MGGSLQFAHGAVQWLAADAATTVYTVNGLPFRPKALRFYWTGLQNAADAASQTVHMRKGVGFAVGTASRACVGSQSQDAAGTQVCTTGYRNDCVAMTLTSTPAADGLLDLNSITSDGFTLIVDDQAPASITVFWEAWGGDHIMGAAIGEIAEPGATGSVSYVCGLEPDVVMFAGVQGTAAANTATRNDAALMVGAASGPAATNNCVMVGDDDDASATSDTDGYAKSGECMAMIAVGSGNPDARAVLTSMNYDGFTLNWTNRATTNRRYIYLAIRGGAWAVGSFTIAGNSGGSTTTVQTLRRGGQPFRPVGLSFFGMMRAESAAGTSSAEDRQSMGSASSTSSRRAQGCWSENANATAAEIDLVLEYDSILAWPSNAGAILATLDLNAVNADGFQAIVDTAGGVASQWQAYVACGSARVDHTLNNYHTNERTR